jgi:hypothetical protein
MNSSQATAAMKSAHQTYIERRAAVQRVLAHALVSAPEAAELAAAASAQDLLARIASVNQRATVAA